MKTRIIVFIVKRMLDLLAKIDKDSFPTLWKILAGLIFNCSWLLGKEMKKLIPLLFVLCGCYTNNQEAIHTLEVNGFTDINIYSSTAVFPYWEGCSEKDGAAYKATATNPREQHVDVLVCCGGPLSLKGCTVRVP